MTNITDNQLAAYFAGQLEGEELEQVERAIETDPALAALADQWLDMASDLCRPSASQPSATPNHFAATAAIRPAMKRAQQGKKPTVWRPILVAASIAALVSVTAVAIVRTNNIGTGPTAIPSQLPVEEGLRSYQHRINDPQTPSQAIPTESTSTTTLQRAMKNVTIVHRNNALVISWHQSLPRSVAHAYSLDGSFHTQTNTTDLRGTVLPLDKLPYGTSRLSVVLTLYDNVDGQLDSLERSFIVDL